MERIKVADAAKLLGVSEQYIRIGLQRKILPITSHQIGYMRIWVKKSRL